MIWIIIIVMLFFSAIFSGLEIAYVTSDKLQIELESKQGSFIGKILSRFAKSPSRFLATLLIGNNLALVIYGTFFEKLLEKPLEEIVFNSLLILLVQTIISTSIILVFAEFLPKSLFRIQPNKMLKVFAIPMSLMYAILTPIVKLFVWLSKIIIKLLFKIDVDEDKPIFGRVELENYIAQRTEGDNQKEEVDTEIQIYKNVLDFSNVKAKDCMVPRTEIVAMEINSSVEDLNLLFIETGLSKILIYKETIDETIGFVHSFEMFKKPNSIQEILLPIGIVPETISAQEALNKFIQQRKSVMLVVDEFGGTSGMLTIEDIMEEIFGEIEDEHDILDRIEEQISDYEYQFSGRFEIEYLNERYNFKLPTSDDYNTLGGLIFTELERIPEEGETITVGTFSLLVEKVSETRIELVKLVIHPETEE